MQMDREILNSFSKDIVNHNMEWDTEIEGMVGTVIRESELLLCGKPLMKIMNFKIVWTTNNCHVFHFGTYSWIDKNISLNEDRIFSQAIDLATNEANKTFFLMGGFNENSLSKYSLQTTEYLNHDENIFHNGPEMPEAFGAHCAKAVNATHIFTSGGYQGNGPIAKGNYDCMRCFG